MIYIAFMPIQTQDTAQITDKNGFIEIPDNPLSKVGIFEYWGSEINAPDKSKMYKVLRPEEELSSAATQDSFRGMPLVNDHTMLGSGQTDPAKKGIDGVIGDKVYYKDGTLYGNLRLYTNKIKNLVAKGKRDLSLGYYSRYDFTPGTWQGQTYDAVQRFITGNHVALVDAGRMGDTVAVLDSAQNLTITFDHKAVEMTIDQDQLAKVVAEAIAPLIVTMDAQAATIAAMQKTMDESTKKDEKEDDKDDKDKKSDVKIEEDDKDDKDKTATEDEDNEDDKDKKETMDAATITAHVMKEIKAKEELVKLSAPLIGTFDHSAMSSIDVATYAADKLKLAGEPETALRAYAKGINLQKTATQDAQTVQPAGKDQLRAGAYA